MANRHMKRCLTLLIIRKCKSKLTIRYHLTPVRISILKKKKKSKCWWGCREKQTPVPCWYECKLLHQLWKTVWRFLKKLKVELSYNPSIILPGLYLKKMKTQVQKDTCTPIFIAALLTIAKIWNQPKCPLTDEWIKKMCYICTWWNITHP